MHFRLRNHIVQVIRTTYDPATKKPRTEIVGRLHRHDAEPGADLLAACTPAELEEVRRWIAGQGRARVVAAEHAALSLTEQMALAGEWFASTPDEDAARRLASELQTQWAALRSVLRRRHLTD